MTMGIVASQCLSSRDKERVICYLKCGKCNFTMMKHVYNEAVSFIASYAVYCVINGLSNLNEMATVVGKEGMVSHVSRRFI